MSFDLESYLDDLARADTRVSRARPQKPLFSTPTPAPKASYEGNPEVQQWIRATEVGEEGRKPPFAPAFLAHRKDAPWLRSSLGHFYEHELIIDIVREVKSGKEASVFCCAAHPSSDKEWLAAKIYRPRMFRSLKNDVVYRANRDQRDESGRVLSARRRQRAASHSERDRGQQVADWIAFEYATQRLVYEAGAAVPEPISQIGNAILMAYLGDGTNPALRLSDLTLAAGQAQTIFDAIIQNIALFLQCHRIHGDLSPYNIVVWEGRPWIIDFAQAVDARYHDEAVFDLLRRDVARVCAGFAPYGIATNAELLAMTLWRNYLTGS